MTTTLITGASSGLGAEMARQLAARGEDLALCARRLDRLEALRDEITARHPGRRVALRALDVTDADAVPRVFDELRTELGGLDRVVVNAGLGKGAPLGTGRADANRETAVTNFVAGLAQVEAAMTGFRAQASATWSWCPRSRRCGACPGRPRRTPRPRPGSRTWPRAAARAARHPGPDRRDRALPGYIASEMNDRADGRGPDR